MSKKLICPECGHDKFNCDAFIKATIITDNNDGEINYTFYEWDYVENIEYFECKNCDFLFDGNEEQIKKASEFWDNNKVIGFVASDNSE